MVLCLLYVCCCLGISCGVCLFCCLIVAGGFVCYVISVVVVVGLVFIEFVFVGLCLVCCLACVCVWLLI